MLEKKIFPINGIDNDTDLRLIEEGSYLNLQNARIGISEYGKSSRIENILGTTLVTNNKVPPYGTNMCIGSCIDEENNRLIFFLYNTLSDNGIYCWDIGTSTMYSVLYDSQIAGGLGFNKNYLIARNCKVINGLLYWTDNYNEPKKINIDSGIKLNQTDYVTDQVAYTSLTDSYEITLIRRPPIYSPTIAKATNASFTNNFIQYESFQFAWQYLYYDGESSTLSEFSTASKLNEVLLGVADTYNYITATLSLSEQIPQTARIIRLVVKYQTTGYYFVANTWDKVINPTPFIDHNSGAVQLSYNFYANKLGETIDSVTAVTPFYSVPLQAKSLETATLRVFLANNLEGYNTPPSTSLSITQTAGTISNSPFIITRKDSQTGTPPTITGSYALLMTGSPQIGDIVSILIAVYDVTMSPTNSSTTINYVVTATNILIVESDIRIAIQANSVITAYHLTATDQTVPALATLITTTSGNSKVLYVNVTITYITPPTLTNQLFKNESSYQAGTVFYDKALRKCGVSTNSGSLIQTPLKTYANNVGTTALNWSVNNNAATTEIPDWAYYYAIVRTLNLQTRYFIDSYAETNFYADKNATTGVYAFTKTAFDTSVVAIAINSTPLVQSQLGYTFAEGDVCVLLSSLGVRYSIPVIGQDGTYILLKAQDIGSLASAAFTYEIYTPYIKSENEPFYEVGNMYPITNPTASNRTYSTLSGTLLGDIFVFQRQYNSAGYYVQAMSPNDKYYQYWFTDAGRINLVTLLGQARNENQIRFSGTYVKGTQNNNLSSFYALNQTPVPLNVGAIQKLQLTTKTEEQGTIMLGICTNQTVSCYLGQVQLVGASANAFVAQDTAVIGTINVLRGMFGTTVPETVVEYLGLVFWYDLNDGAIVQYSSNGLFPISSYKMSRFFQRYAKNYIAASTANLDNINGFHHISSMIDPFHKRAMVVLPALIYSNYASQLPSYSSVPSYATSIINRNDAYDELGKTMSFDFSENRWKESYEFLPEWSDYMQNISYGFKNGALYMMNNDTTNYNKFFGTFYPVRLAVTPQGVPSGIKDSLNIQLEASAAPDFSYAYSPYPNIQISDLVSTDYTNVEGVFDTPIFKDRLSPSVSGTADEKLYTGDTLLSPTPILFFEWQQYTKLFYANFVNFGFEVSRGQKQLISK